MPPHPMFVSAIEIRATSCRASVAYRVINSTGIAMRKFSNVLDCFGFQGFFCGVVGSDYDAWGQWGCVRQTMESNQGLGGNPNG
jgi:hypothetical protein